MHREYGEMLSDFTREQRKMMLNNTISISGKIVTVYPNGYYKVLRLDNNKYIDYIGSEVPGYKWREGQAVTAEYNGVSWSIVGRSPVSGGGTEDL